MAATLTDGGPSAVVTRTNGDLGLRENGDVPLQDEHSIRPRPPTTTISTIAVQSGNTRIVIALLQSKEWIQLKIQEMQPSMTDIGTNLEEATELNQQHEKVLEKLQTKQSPVEELLRQADELIATQKPRGEVYSAMAENLGLAWKDLNAQLEQRRQILEQAVAFFTQSRDFNDILDRIQKNLTDSYLPDSAELCTTMMQRHQEERKVALSCSMHMLKEGQVLLERLCEVATHSMGDSRPFHMQHAARQTSNFVERHMEALHDRWRHLEALWMQRKLKLEQCLRRCQFLAELNEVQAWLSTKGNEYATQTNLGDSLASAEILQHEHSKAEKESKEKQDLTLKLVRTAEQLAHTGNYAGEEIKGKAYEVLSECSELLNVLESRSLLLSIAVVFFNSAQTALNKFDQIELQLTTSENLSTPAQQSNLNVAVEEVTSSAIEEGHNLIARVGSHEPGIQGVVRKVAELEKRRRYLLELWHACQFENSERAAALRNFNNNYNLLLTWVTTNGQGFLQRNRDMGSTQPSAQSFVSHHEILQNDLQVKTIEVESLLSTVPELVRVGGSDAQDVMQKSEHLREQLSQLRIMLDKRILLGHSYLSFHKLAAKVRKNMEDLESDIKKICEGSTQVSVRTVEEKLLTLQQETLQLKNSGRNFLEDAQKVEEIYLNMTQPCNTVQSILDDIDSRKVILITQWTNWQNQMSSAREAMVQWEQLVRDSQRVIKCVVDLECKMFPVIPKELNRVESILPFLENRMAVLLPQIKSVQQEMDNFLKKSDVLCPKDKPKPEDQKVISELQKMNQSFQKQFTDYQILVSMMTAYFKNFEELEKMVDMQESQFKVASLPDEASKIETLLHDHNACRPTVLELFKFTLTESEQVIAKINEAEPFNAALQDKEKITSLYRARKTQFENAWENHKKKLEQHFQMCAFNRDMQQINQQIQDLNAQLAAMKENYGDSLPSAIVTSEAFIQFEKTIEILEIRIRNFISTAEKMMLEKKVDPSQVRREIQSMQSKWSSFRTQVTKKRHLIEISIEYYKLVEECEEWLKEGSRVLMSIARQSSLCKTTGDAESLNKEIQDFLNRGRIQQEERIKKLSSLSLQLYGNKGHPSIQHVTNKNKDMFDSFTVIRTELNILTENIKITEVEKGLKEVKEKEELDAALHAAQAEAEAAKAAAVQAKEAAKAAEAAAKAVPVQKAPPPVMYQPPRFVIPLKDAEVAEGTKVTLECKVEGYPQPQIQWFKDSMLAESNPDYQTKFQDGVCTLTIEETFSEDTAKFTCRASNSAGIAETSGKLYVKESRPPDGLIPPHFINEPHDAKVIEGTLHRFDCQVSGNPLPLVSWFKDDVCIDSSTDYSVMYNNGFCTLCLEETSPDHAGRYTCRAVNQAGQVACSVTLQVQTSAPIERPVFVTPLSNVMARAGQKLRLECAVTGQPKPEITWLQNSKAIKETRDIKMHFDGHKATLVITEAFPKDAGIYSIVAKNKAGEAVSTCNVSVKGRLPLETSDSEMASDIEPAKPQVKQQLVDQTVKEGDRVRMDCIIVGQPEPEVIWYHNGKPVKESNDFQLLFEGDRCTLVIKVAYLEDAGTYKCVAINSGGEASSQCQLHVQSSAKETIEKSHFSQKEIIFTVEQSKPPKFIRLLKDLAVSEGQPTKFECQVAGEPEVKIKWFKDGVEIHSSKDFEIKEDDAGTTSLSIHNTKPVHQGSYTVSAQNKGGEAKNFCTLTVLPPPVIQKPIQESPPKFIQYIEESKVSIGQPAKFECIVIGIPKPKVRWNFQGQPICTDKDHQLGEDGDKKWLVIRSVLKEHAGRYSVVAENNAGISTSSALLHVEEPFESISTDSFYEQKAQTMIMSKKTTVVEKCTISSMAEVVEPPPVIEAVSSKVMPEKAVPSMPQIVKSEPIPPAVVTVVPERILKPPKFVKPLCSNLVTEGEKLFLEAQIDGIPEPTVQWLKDGVQLQNKPDLVILYSAGYASLMIPKAVESNSGQYSCVASNDAGRATCIAEVRVKPYREAPKFFKRLEARVVKSGDRVNFEVEVKGVPTPVVQWYRNGLVIESSPDFRISSDGNKHSLLIPKAFPDDSGLFMVTAQNAAGEAKCLADLIVEDDRSPEEEKVISYQQVSSIEQKKEMFTKVTAAKPISVEPYQQPAMEPEKKIEVVPKTVEVVPKTPSPPPMPAVSAKVWPQTKPELFTTKIEQAPSVQDLPIVEEPADFSLELVDADESVQPQLVSASFTTPLTTVQSHSFVKQTVMKFADQQQQDQPVPVKEQQVVKPPQPEVQPVSAKPVPSSLLNGVEQKQEVFTSFKQESTQFSQSFKSSSSTLEKSVPVAPKFVPKSIESFIPSPVWSPGQFQEKEVKSPPKPVESSSLKEGPILASADITQYRDVAVTPVSETAVLTDGATSSFYASSSSTTSVRQSFTRITKEETSKTSQFEVTSQQKVTSTGSKPENIPKPIIKKKESHVAEGPKPKKAVVIEEEPVVGAEVKPPVFSKVRGTECLWKIT